MDYCLKQVDPQNPHPLLINMERNEMTIGRSTVTSLSGYNKVSRYHASLTRRNGSWYITDLGSLNNLFVNLVKVEHSVRLDVGDIIGFGSPSVSTDGGFVCVLTARTRVKQELVDVYEDSSKETETGRALKQCSINANNGYQLIPVDRSTKNFRHEISNIHPDTTTGRYGHDLSTATAEYRYDTSTATSGYRLDPGILPAEYRHNLGTTPLEYRHDPVTAPIEYRHDPVSTTTRYMLDTGTVVSGCRLYPSTAPAEYRHNLDTTPVEYKRDLSTTTTGCRPDPKTVTGEYKIDIKPATIGYKLGGEVPATSPDIYKAGDANNHARDRTNGDGYPNMVTFGSKICNVDSNTATSKFNIDGIVSLNTTADPKFDPVYPGIESFGYKNSVSELNTSDAVYNIYGEVRPRIQIPTVTNQSGLAIKIANISSVKQEAHSESSDTDLEICKLKTPSQHVAVSNAISLSKVTSNQSEKTYPHSLNLEVGDANGRFENLKRNFEQSCKPLNNLIYYESLNAFIDEKPIDISDDNTKNSVLYSSLVKTEKQTDHSCRLFTESFNIDRPPDISTVHTNNVDHLNPGYKPNILSDGSASHSINIRTNVKQISNTRRYERKHSNSHIQLKNHNLVEINKDGCLTQTKNNVESKITDVSSVVKNTYYCEKGNNQNYLTGLLMNCRIQLVKCDSKAFRWPSDVIKKNPFKVSSRLKTTENKVFEFKEKISLNSSFGLSVLTEKERTSNAQSVEESFQEESKYQNVSKRLKVRRNRILSSDSESSGSVSDFGEMNSKRLISIPREISSGFNNSPNKTGREHKSHTCRSTSHTQSKNYVKTEHNGNRILDSDSESSNAEANCEDVNVERITSCNETSFENVSENETLKHHKSYQSYNKLATPGSNNHAPQSQICMRRKKPINNSKAILTAKRAKLIESEDSDSSLSCHSLILYPSSEVLRGLKAKERLLETSQSDCSKSQNTDSDSSVNFQPKTTDYSKEKNSFEKPNGGLGKTNQKFENTQTDSKSISHRSKCRNSDDSDSIDDPKCATTRTDPKRIEHHPKNRSKRRTSKDNDSIDDDQKVRTRTDSKNMEYYSKNRPKRRNSEDSDSIKNSRSVSNAYSNKKYREESCISVDKTNPKPDGRKIINSYKPMKRKPRNRFQWQNSEDSDFSDDFRSEFASSNRRKPLGESYGTGIEDKPKSAGRTLLTNPKPMEKRPKSIRGREEWFHERCAISNTEVSSNGLSQDSYLQEKSESRTNEVFISKKLNASECAEEQKEYVVKRNSIVHLQWSDDSFERSCLQRIPEKSISQTATSPGSCVTNRAIPAVPRRPKNFGSRMGFLVDISAKLDKKPIAKKKVQPQEVKPVKNKREYEQSDSENSVSGSELKGKSKISNGKETIGNCVILDQNSNIANKEKLKPLSRSRKEVSGKVAAVQDLSSKSKPAMKQDKEPSKTDLGHRVSSDQVSKYVTGLVPKQAVESSKSNDRFPCPNKTSNESNKNVQVRNVKSDILPNSSVGSLAKQSVESSRSNETLSLSKKTSNESKQHFLNKNNKKVAVVSPIYQTDKGTNSSSSTTRSKRTLVGSNSLIEMIVSWNPKWLEEQRTNKKPPPLISKGAALLNLSYPTYETYVFSFLPMIVLEVWESLFRNSKPYFVMENENWNNFYYTIESYESKRGVTELQCESVVNETLSYCPREGNVVLLDVKDKERKIENCIFGYIHRHRIEEFKYDAGKSSEWNKMPDGWLEQAKLWKFGVYVKKSRKSIELGSVNLAHGVLDVRCKLQLADALHSFHASPLRKGILHPSEESFCDSSEKANWSREQIVQSVSNELKNPESNSNIILLRAPAGTGKTSSVVDLIEKMLFSNFSKPKILLCSPSTSALDEIGRRLIELNGRSSWRSNSVKFVRLGAVEQMCPIMQEYSLAVQTSKQHNELSRKKLQQRDRELGALEKKINEVLFEQRKKLNCRYRKINSTKTLHDLVCQFKSLKEKNLLEHIDSITQKSYEFKILKESDVLLSTLDCCMLPEVDVFLKDETGSPLACCIVDEAAQCTEPEVLQCLHPEISRLVLVGDSQQLPPTVISKYAARCGFRRSMFERFCLYYKKKFHRVPAFTLTEQQRMHSQICHFPSKYFYNHELTTSKDTDERCVYFPLKPYIVFDIMDEGGSDLCPNPSDTESLIVGYICSQLMQSAATASIGVIVAVEEQKSLCNVVLSKHAKYRDVEVNILEGFQGREKDIIIIPCIRPFLAFDEDTFISCERRMNVAVTRARQCLIICGHVSSLAQYPHWKALLEDAMTRNNYLCVASMKHIPLVFTKTITKL